ncbi:DUF3592 domain-containing protein [Streptomyces sp. NPDC059761]|uniref:DUF3592 domain-containing protein n=1 Tax=Streptomyces sp. NPDC059761 TaxID=3346937 RepID=UPI003667FF15
MSDSVWAVLCAAVAVLLFGTALRDRAVVRQLCRHGVRTQGRVVDRVQDTSGDSPIWVPVIAFVDGDGQRAQFEPKLRGTGLDLPVGCEVEVVYLARKPRTARLSSRQHMAGPTLFLAFGGALFLGAAILIATRS